MAIELTTATTQQLSGIRQSLAISVPFSSILPNTLWRLTYGAFPVLVEPMGPVIDFKGCQNLAQIGGPGGGTWTNIVITTILNAQELINLKDSGTTKALNLQFASLSESTINQLFTDLPATNNTATIDVGNNPGAATCNTSIATNKGYTVVTS